jgi:hypothetical protein
MDTSTLEAPSAHRQSAGTSRAEATDTGWGTLYRVGGTASLAAVALIVLAVMVFLAWPPPTSIEQWFALFQRNGFLGLLDLDLLLVASYVVLIPLYLALYVALRRVSPSLMAMAVAFNLVGAALILAVNPAAAMLSLSDRYFTTTSEAQRATLLAAGQALMANWSGSAFDVGYLLGGVGILLTAAVMLKSAFFGKIASYVGLVMGALMLIPASAGTVGLMLSLLSLMPTAIWLILVGRKLMMLARLKPLSDERRLAP